MFHRAAFSRHVIQDPLQTTDVADGAQCRATELSNIGYYGMPNREQQKREHARDDDRGGRHQLWSKNLMPCLQTVQPVSLPKLAPRARAMRPAAVQVRRKGKSREGPGG
jgi:hypothetical protein